MKRRTAYSRVVMPDGRVLRREVIVFAADGSPESHFPLCEELPFVEWRDETYRLTAPIPCSKPED